ncbi:MAG: haloacid dehalogenase [Cyanobacteria bacterium J06623_5]
MPERLILTALDGDWLDSDERVAQLKAAIAQLEAQQVPVIVYSERDRAELEPLRAQIGLTSPFIVESGSAIFAPLAGHPFSSGQGEEEDGYFVVTLGCPYVQARAGLRVIANEISHPLKGFGDFTVPQLQRLMGSSESAAHLAKAREFSEPFMTPKAVEGEELIKAAVGMGFKVILRPAQESRFSELLGAAAGLEAAVGAVISAYRRQAEPGQSLTVNVIGTRPAELAALSEVCRRISDVDEKSVLLSSSRGSGAALQAWLDAIAPFLTHLSPGPAQ